MNPISEVTSAAKSAFDLKFFLKLLFGISLVIAALDLIGSFSGGIVNSDLVLDPVGFWKSKFGKG